MQCPSVQLDEVVSLLRKTETDLNNLRKTGFVAAQVSGKVVYDNLNVDSVLLQRGTRSTKRHSCYGSPSDAISNVLKNIPRNLVQCCVDAAVSHCRKGCRHW